MRPRTARPVSGAVTLSVLNIPPLLPPVTSPDRLPPPLTPRLWSYTMRLDRSMPVLPSPRTTTAGSKRKTALSPQSDAVSPLLGSNVYTSSRPGTARQRFPWHRIAIGYSGKTAKKPVRGKAGIRSLLYSEAGLSRSEARLPLVSPFTPL